MDEMILESEELHRVMDEIGEEEDRIMELDKRLMELVENKEEEEKEDDDEFYDLAPQEVAVSPPPVEFGGNQ